MKIEIDSDTLFPEGLSDEAVSAIHEVFAEIARHWENQHFHQLKRFHAQQQRDCCDPLKPWRRKNLD